MGVQFYAAVYANLASAYARLFLFEEAADCLWKSYETVRSNEIYRRYLATLSLFLSREDYEKRLDELKVPKVQREKIEAWLEREPAASGGARDRRERALESGPDLSGGRETRLSQKYLCVITKSRSRKRSVFCNIQSQADFLLKV